MKTKKDMQLKCNRKDVITKYRKDIQFDFSHLKGQRETSIKSDEQRERKEKSVD